MALAGAVVVLLGALGLIAAQSAAATPAPTGTDTTYVVLAAGPAGTGSDGVGAPVEGGPGPYDTVADAVSTGPAAHLGLAPVLVLLALAGSTLVVGRVGVSRPATRRRAG